jgi:hypothetical protein
MDDKIIMTAEQKLHILWLNAYYSLKILIRKGLPVKYKKF